MLSLYLQLSFALPLVEKLKLGNLSNKPRRPPKVKNHYVHIIFIHQVIYMYTAGIEINCSWDSSSKKTLIIAKNMPLTPSKGVL